MSLLPPLFPLALAFITGCHGPADKCAPLDVQECMADDACRTINGVPIVHDDEVGTCRDRGAWGPVGCMDATGGCEDHVRRARPPEEPSECWIFMSWCIPLDWVDCGADTGLPACPR